MKHGPIIAEYRITCEGAPVQIEGRLTTGECFYFRARHRQISLGIGDTPETAPSDPQTLGIVFQGFPDDDHLVSCLSDPMPLVNLMIEAREGAIEWAVRRANGDTFRQQLEARVSRETCDPECKPIPLSKFIDHSDNCLNNRDL